MASKQVSFCWGNFQKNISSGMNSLLQNEDFVDVTLAVEGKYLKAHKMVLSLCSPYFRELFKTSPCQHPIVFLQDVPYTIMSDLLQFMYKGEVKISQDDLPVFIKTGKALQIIGIGDDYHNRFHSDQESTTEVPQNDHLKSKKTPLLESSIQPPLKRQRNRSSEQQQQKEESILQSLLKTGRISNNNNNNNNNDNNCSKKSKTQNTEEIVHLKLEACDQIQSLTDRSITIKNEFNDDHSDNTNIDDLSKENGYNEPTTDELKSTDAGPCTEQFGEPSFEILELIKEANRKLDSISEMLLILTNDRKGDQNTSKIGELLPLKSKENVDKLDQQIQDTTFKNELEKCLLLVGGDDIHKNVYNILKKLFSPDLTLQYSFTGKGGKECFNTLNLSSLVKSKVQFIYY